MKVGTSEDLQPATGLLAPHLLCGRSRDKAGEGGAGERSAQNWAGGGGLGRGDQKAEGHRRGRRGPWP